VLVSWALYSLILTTVLGTICTAVTQTSSPAPVQKLWTAACNSSGLVISAPYCHSLEQRPGSASMAAVLAPSRVLNLASRPRITAKDAARHTSN
jgi:hypothetical protein